MKIKFYSSTNYTPQQKTSGSAGYDITSAKDMTIKPNERVIIPTGLYCSIPQGYEIQVRNRSGMSYKKGFLVIPGTIDSDYRGEIGVIAMNITSEDLKIQKDTRIAQMIIAKYESFLFEKVESPLALDKTIRGDQGWGSTGIN